MSAETINKRLAFLTPEQREDLINAVLDVVRDVAVPAMRAAAREAAEEAVNRRFYPGPGPTVSE